MKRRLLTLLLMLSMCWQALAYAGAGVWLAKGEDRAHAWMHFSGDAHHHDDAGKHDRHDQVPVTDARGGEVRDDGSPGSQQHVMCDQCVCAPVLLIGVAPLPKLMALATQPAEACATEPPLPFLSAPERPPKPRA
jgi:hypothetical protein